MSGDDIAQRVGELRAELSRLTEQLAQPELYQGDEERRLRVELARVEAERASLLAQAREVFGELDALEAEAEPLREAKASSKR